MGEGLSPTRRYDTDTPSPNYLSFSGPQLRTHKRQTELLKEAKSEVFAYSEMFYNPKCQHVNNGTLSPIENEKGLTN